MDFTRVTCFRCRTVYSMTGRSLPLESLVCPCGGPLSEYNPALDYSLDLILIKQADLVRKEVDTNHAKT